MIWNLFKKKEKPTRTTVLFEEVSAIKTKTFKKPEVNNWEAPKPKEKSMKEISLVNVVDHSPLIRSENPICFKVDHFPISDVMMHFSPRDIEYLGPSRVDSYPCFAYHGGSPGKISTLMVKYTVTELIKPKL
jgi:hypothetical protein